MLMVHPPFLSVHNVCRQYSTFVLNSSKSSAVSFCSCRLHRRSHSARHQTNKSKSRFLSRSSERFNYYEVLGVSKEASNDDIKKAFVAKSKELHPDLNPSQKSHSQFVRLNEAYTTLKSAHTRRDYDHKMGYSSSSPQHPHSFYGGGVPPQAGRTMYYEVYNSRTGQREWRSFDGSSAGYRDSSLNRRLREEDFKRNFRGRQNDNFSSTGSSSRDQSIYSFIVRSYVATFVAVFLLTIVGSYFQSKRNHHYRSLDYERLMYLSSLRGAVVNSDKPIDSPDRCPKVSSRQTPPATVTSSHL